MKNFIGILILVFLSTIAFADNIVIDKFDHFNFVNQNSYMVSYSISLNQTDFIDSQESLQIEYSAAYNGYIYFDYFLNTSIDLSEYDYISFYVKSASNPIGEYLQFSLITSASDYFRHIDYSALHYTNWHRIKVALRELPQGKENEDGFAIDPWEFKTKKWDIKNIIGYRFQIVNYGMNGYYVEDKKLHSGKILIDNLIALKEKENDNLISNVSISPHIVTPNNDNVNDNLKLSFKLNNECYIEILIYNRAGENIINFGKRYYNKGSQFLVIKPNEISESLEKGIYILLLKIEDISGKYNEKVKKTFVVY